MSVETIGWFLGAFAVIVLASLGFFYGVMPELYLRENRETQRMMYQIAQMLRQEISLIPDLVRILEDLMRLEPERAEAMGVTRADLLQKRANMQEVVDRLEKRWEV